MGDEQAVWGVMSIITHRKVSIPGSGMPVNKTFHGPVHAGNWMKIPEA